MPFYEYQCQACGAQVEALQKISDAPLKKCPECGKAKLQKLISAPSFRLAGGGWYETDFKSDKDKKRNLVETEKGEAKSEDKKSEDKKSEDKQSEAKPEAKSEKKEESKSEAKPAEKPDRKQPAKSAKKKARR